MRAQKKPSGGKHRGLNSTESGRAFRVQIYRKITTYANNKFSFREVKI